MKGISQLLCRYLAFFAILFSSAPSLAKLPTVISLSPHSTELAYAAGLGDQMLAASEYSDYPEQAKGLERVANYRGIKLERIVTLNPGLILAWKGGNPPRQMEALENLGFKVVYTNPDSLEDIADAVDMLGKWSPSPEKATALANSLRSRFRQIQQDYRGKRPVSYFYQLSGTPLMTVSSDNWPAPVFETCGGKNIFNNSPAAYPQVSPEQVIVRKPEVIFVSRHAEGNSPWWKNWSNEIPAVENKTVWTLNTDWLNRPTPRTLKALEQVCGYLDAVRESEKIS
ncbi:vitamin B12 ABC transporter substrate-binding protein BtuF [Parasalinivibrio latis]|uniref:vitamin B12 ABC transporter substrate-binding protein BtuF n=1 Tax=Parasalinivibrio latis TaxID=2952610 RepID=UPI0030DF8E1F